MEEELVYMRGTRYLLDTPDHKPLKDIVELSGVKYSVFELDIKQSTLSYKIVCEEKAMLGVYYLLDTLPAKETLVLDPVYYIDTGEIYDNLHTRKQCVVDMESVLRGMGLKDVHTPVRYHEFIIVGKEPEEVPKETKPQNWVIQFIKKLFTRKTA